MHEVPSTPRNPSCQPDGQQGVEWNASWGVVDLISVLLDGLFELLL